jgi:CRISPR-associated protein Cmr4
MIPELYTLHCLTPLHVGRGDEGYDYIDKRVQRDPVTGFPCIHGSSLKGALREHFEGGIWMRPNASTTHKSTYQVFGSSVGERDENGGAKTAQGDYRFLSAQLLALPVRSNVQPYFMATCPQLITDLLEQAALMGYRIQPDLLKALQLICEQPAHPWLLRGIPAGSSTVFLEDHAAAAGPASVKLDEAAIRHLEQALGGPVAVLPDKVFCQLVESLPIVARNQLENGESRNLWYEELVPRATRFWFMLMRPEVQAQAADFQRHLTSSTIQVGANASVGHGFTRIQTISQP